MLRRLSTLLSAASLVLCVATCGLWVRSYWRADMVMFNTGPAWVRVVTTRGAVELTASNPSPYPAIRLVHRSYRPWWLRGDDSSYVWRFGGFGFANIGKISRSPFWRVLVPLWFVTLATGLGSSHIISRVFRRRYPSGLCPNCGYDLRATPGRCPECGTEPKGAAA